MLNPCFSANLSSLEHGWLGSPEWTHRPISVRVTQAIAAHAWTFSEQAELALDKKDFFQLGSTRKSSGSFGAENSCHCQWGQPVQLGLALTAPEAGALLSCAVPPSSEAGWLKCVPSLAVLSHFISPPDIHTPSVVPALWALLPQHGIQVGIKAGVASCHAICLQHRQNHIALKGTEHPPKGRQPRWAPWSGWCGVFLCSHQRHPLSVTPALSSRMEKKISLSCHVRQEHRLWGHITARYTSLTSASPSTSSHLEPVTCTMQQIDLLLSYHSSTIFLSGKKLLMLNILATFKKIAAEFHSHWVSFEQVVVTYFLAIYFLEITRDELLMKYIWNAKCGWRTKINVEESHYR